jgi:hypothetical protein
MDIWGVHFLRQLASTLLRSKRGEGGLYEVWFKNCISDPDVRALVPGNGPLDVDDVVLVVDSAHLFGASERRGGRREGGEREKGEKRRDRGKEAEKRKEGGEGGRRRKKGSRWEEEEEERKKEEKGEDRREGSREKVGGSK